MKNMTIQQFAMQTASNEPVPGGGSISALAGSLAAALTEMVAGPDHRKEKIRRGGRRDESSRSAYAANPGPAFRGY